MLVYEYHLTLRLTQAGRLLPWLGLALRGLVAGAFRDQVCVHPPEDRRDETKWLRCKGCPEMAGCAYGQLYEPDLQPGVAAFRGQEDGIRPLVMAPYFPVTESGQVGLEIPVRMMIAGQKRDADVELLLATLDRVGRTNGFGGEQVTFDLVDSGMSTGTGISLDADALPSHSRALPGHLPRVGVGLTAPLFLRNPDKSSAKKRLDRPEFTQLFRAAMRTVSRLFALAGEPIEADFADLAQAADQVELEDACYEVFSQPHHSNRGNQHRSLYGVVGSGLYANVPMSLLPWMVWGGRLHVGPHRIAGAGSWRLILD